MHIKTSFCAPLAFRTIFLRLAEMVEFVCDLVDRINADWSYKLVGFGTIRPIDEIGQEGGGLNGAALL